MDKKEKIKRSVFIIVIMIVACLSIISARERRAKMKEKQIYNLTGDYNIDLIKKFHELDGNTNYLISPYNIEIALNMLRDGADGTTKEELDKVLGNRTINSVSVKDKIGVANGVFIKNIYQNDVKNEYYNILKTKYNSDIIYDEFIKPDKINNWVKNKTNGMIEKILDKINENFVLGLASALAIDVKWDSQFDCISTTSGEFTKIDDSKINVEMMHKTYEYNAKYFKNSDAEGIIIPYQKEDNSTVQLEFVGIIPNDNINTYISNLNKEKLDSIDKNMKEASENLHINLSLPRFKYDYSASDNFIKVLNNLGIKEAFDENKANFKSMIDVKDNVYVGEAIHKTHIELNEVGTKAAAITYFGMFAKSAINPNEPEIINININKPFVYMLREVNTGEILFFGEVIEPNLWHGSTCDK